jgi:preprotein translocase subunit SecG
MFIALIVLHVLTSIILVLVVLLQSGRGAELGAAFGGIGQSTFGRGQSTFISKLTTVLAVVFMATSLSLSLIASERPSQSILQPGAAPAPAAPVPATPAPAPAAPAAAPAAPAVPALPQTPAPSK